MSAARHTIERSRAEPVNELAVGVNERTNERVAQYSTRVFLNDPAHRAVAQRGLLWAGSFAGFPQCPFGLARDAQPFPRAPSQAPENAGSDLVAIFGNRGSSGGLWEYHDPIDLDIFIQ